MKKQFICLLLLLALTVSAQTEQRQITVTENVADNTQSGHGGTYEQPNGGANSRMVRAWLDWQLKGKENHEKLFAGGDLTGYDGFTIKQKNFSQKQKQKTTANTQELWIDNGNRHIYGELYTPEKPKKNAPIAIIAHGFNGSFHYGRNYFDLMGRLGYHCYTFDFPCGSMRSRSDNNTLNMSILDEVSDLKAIVNYFRSKGHRHIVLIGGSQGGLVSALTAAELKDKVGQLVLVYPALCIPDNWRQRYPRKEDIQDITELWGVKMGRRFFEEIHDMRPLDLIGQYHGPVTIIQGDADRVVSMDDSRRAQQLYRPGTLLHVIAGAGHGFKPQEFQQEVELLEKFLK